MTIPDRPTRRWPSALAALLALAAGCLQIDTQVELHPDGSATVTEKARFSRRLLDLAERAEGELKLVALLDKPAVLDRMKQMGEGIRLVRHEVETFDSGAKQSTAVYKIPDINHLVYVSPFIRDGGYPYRSRIQFRMFPVVSDRYTGERGGDLGLQFREVSNGREPPKRKKAAPKPPPPSPRDLQNLRKLQPVFCDLMRGLRLRLTFVCYSPTRAPFAGTGRKWNDRPIELIYFDADKHMDAYDYPFLENEEIMLDLLRGQLNSDDFERHLRGFAGNANIPRLHGGGKFWFIPSKTLFRRYLEGKEIRTRRFRRTHPKGYKGTVAFDQVGWTPKKK